MRSVRIVAFITTRNRNATEKAVPATASCFVGGYLSQIVTGQIGDRIQPFGIADNCPKVVSAQLFSDCQP